MKQMPKLKTLIIGLFFLLFVIGLILFFYSYLTSFQGENGVTVSLAQSASFFDYRFFSIDSYDTANFPIIIQLLSALKTGIILASISAIILVDMYVWILLKRKNIF